MLAAPGLPGIEGAAHTSPENTELQLGQWRHLVELCHNMLLILTFFPLFISVFLIVWYVDPEILTQA